jgi:hypothetical protein
MSKDFIDAGLSEAARAQRAASPCCSSYDGCSLCGIFLTMFGFALATGGSYELLGPDVTCIWTGALIALLGLRVL